MLKLKRLMLFLAVTFTSAAAYGQTAKDKAIIAWAKSAVIKEVALETHDELIQSFPTAPLYDEYWAGWDMITEGNEDHAEGERLFLQGQYNTAALYFGWSEQHYRDADAHWINWWEEVLP